MTSVTENLESSEKKQLFSVMQSLDIVICADVDMQVHKGTNLWRDIIVGNLSR